jgi:peroxiredoxin
MATPARHRRHKRGRPLLLKPPERAQGATLQEHIEKSSATDAPASRSVHPGKRQNPRWQQTQRARSARLKRLVAWCGTLATVSIVGLVLWGLLVARAGASTATDTAGASLPDFYGLAGQAAPEFTLSDLAHRPVSLQVFRGKRVLLNFWYAACPGCQAEMPDFERFYIQTQQHNLVIVGVNVLDDAATAARFLQHLGITYTVVLDPQQQVFTRYGMTATPSTVFIDTQGIIRGSVAGPLNAEQLQHIGSLLT